MQIVFAVPAKEESQPYIIEVCKSIMKVWGLHNDEIYRVQLAVEEAVINSIYHAYEPGEEGVIDFTFTLDEWRFSVLIKDYGKGIDPACLTVYDENNEDAITSINGRGLFLMQAMMDEFKLNSYPGEGTEIYLAKRTRGRKNVVEGV